MTVVVNRTTRPPLLAADPFDREEQWILQSRPDETLSEFLSRCAMPPLPPPPPPMRILREGDIPWLDR